MHFRLLSALSLIFMVLPHIEAKTVLVFDSQALIAVNQEDLKQYVSYGSGLLDFLMHPSLNPIDEAQKRFWEQLERHWGKQGGASVDMVRDQDGKRVLPWIMVEWFKGDISGKQAMDRVKAQCPSFVSDVAQVAFNAELLARHSYIIPHALSLIERYAPQAELYMVGNWSLETFQLVVQKHQDIFQKIPVKNRYISGGMHLVLPCDIRIMCSLIADQAKVNIDDIIFVTSMPYHAEAAKHKGISVLLIDNNNITAAQEKIDAALR